MTPSDHSKLTVDHIARLPDLRARQSWVPYGSHIVHTRTETGKARRADDEAEPFLCHSRDWPIDSDHARRISPAEEPSESCQSLLQHHIRTHPSYPHAQHRHTRTNAAHASQRQSCRKKWSPSVLAGRPRSRTTSWISLAAWSQPSSSPPGGPVNRAQADCQPQAWSRAGAHTGWRGQRAASESGTAHRRRLAPLLEREASSCSPLTRPSPRRNASPQLASSCTPGPCRGSERPLGPDGTTLGQPPARSARACSHPSALRTGPTGRSFEEKDATVKRYRRRQWKKGRRDNLPGALSQAASRARSAQTPCVSMLHRFSLSR
jgi:hypothetical protein